jgi:hypothetical protein
MRGRQPVTARGLEDRRLTRQPEVGGGSDGQAPPVGVWREKIKGGGGAAQLCRGSELGRERG